MSRPTEELIDQLNHSFKWKLANPPELDQPVLIVFDYSPSVEQCPICIAFDLSGGPKCWLSESQVFAIDGVMPNHHAGYRQFVFEGRKMYPYSIQALPGDLFTDINRFKSVCQSLYWHTVRR